MLKTQLCKSTFLYWLYVYRLVQRLRHTHYNALQCLGKVTAPGIQTVTQVKTH